MLESIGAHMQILEPGKKPYFNFLAGFLIFFHLVGLVGIILTPYQNWFLSLSSLNLLLTLIAAWWFIPGRFSRKKLIAATTIYGMSYLTEIVGVATSFPFGTYSYGENLGIKCFDVPIIIGVNWLILVIATTSFVPKNWNILSKSALAATAMVALDFVIEQVAPKLSYWSFEGANLTQNYTAWWVLSLAFCSLALKFKLQTESKLGALIYVVQVVFFITLLSFL